MRKQYLPLVAGLILFPFAAPVCVAAEGGTPNVASASIRTLDFRSLPSDAFSHSRIKWNKDLFILIDDDAGAPLLYMFDRTGHIKFDGMIQITGATKVRVTDFTAAPDGSVWTCGFADSGTGQRGFFLAHLMNDGEGVQIIRTNPYHPWYLTVTPDGTLWTAGYGLNSSGKVDLTLDSLRHFDSTGKVMASAISANSVGLIRAEFGYLDFYQGRLVWYSPNMGSEKGPDGRALPEAYVEVSEAQKMEQYSTPAVPRNPGDFAIGFAVTPSGRVFVEMFRAAGSPALYELDRNESRWVLTEGPHNQQGQVSHLLGNDGESLVFADTLANKSELKLQLIDASQTVRVANNLEQVK